MGEGRKDYMRIKLSKRAGWDLKYTYLAKLRYQKTELKAREKAEEWLDKAIEKIAQGKEQADKYTIGQIINRERSRVKTEEYQHIVDNMKTVKETEIEMEFEIDEQSAKIILEETLKSTAEKAKRLEWAERWLERDKEKGKDTLEQEAKVQITKIEMEDSKDLINQLTRGNLEK